MNDTTQQARRKPLKLSPAMASLRLLVLAFVRDYIGEWRYSPSYGEICNALDASRWAVRHAVKSLAEEGLLLRTPGSRGLALPSARDEALRQLRAMGWVIDGGDGRDGGARLMREPGSNNQSPNPPLLPPAELDYIEPGPAGDRHAFDDKSEDEEKDGSEDRSGKEA